MNQSIRLLVIDDNSTVTNKIKEYFRSKNEVNVVACIESGEDAIKYISDFKNNIDMIVLDLLIPGVDGLEILKWMSDNNIKKKIIVLTSYKEDYIVKLTNKYGVNFYMLKPFKVETLEQRIIDVAANEVEVKEIDNGVVNVVSDLLHNLGIPSHVRGYQYIREGIMLIYNNENSITYVTKEIYPEIAERFNTTSSRVERAIRHAIEISWLRGGLKLMEDIFGHSINFERSKPTNSEFLTTIADRMKLDKNIVTN